MLYDLSTKNQELAERIFDLTDNSYSVGSYRGEDIFYFINVSARQLRFLHDFDTLKEVTIKQAEKEKRLWPREGYNLREILERL